MPVVIQIHYPFYLCFAVSGKEVCELTGEQKRCPKCSVGILIFTDRLVDRYLVHPSVAQDNHCIKIRLARCTHCRARIRVLPCDAMPYKVFSVQIIADAVEAYILAENSLRTCTQAFPPACRISHTTLWYWLQGLGERMIDRVFLHKDVHALPLPSLPPIRAILQQTSKTLEQPDLINQWLEPIEVPKHKYRSQKRHDALSYAFKFLNVARALFPKAEQPIMAWQSRIGPFFGYVPLFMFFTCLPCTTFEHPNTGLSPVVFCNQTDDRNDLYEEIEHGCRSPPRGILAF